MIKDYYKNSVVNCNDCKEHIEFAQHITFHKLPPFVGGKHGNVLIIGHSPRVRTKSIISMTLDLNEERQLKRYIIGKILSPLGISIEQCVATNLVKCITDVMPEDMKTRSSEFMNIAAITCKKHIINEILAFNCCLIISLSERVSNLLQLYFDPSGNRCKMKEIFGTLRDLSVEGCNIPWIPVVHIPKTKMRSYYFPKQDERLANIAAKAQALLA